MFLTAKQREFLTGYKPRSKQIEWLTQQGIRFWVNGKGDPVVPVSAIDPKQATPELGAVR